MLYGRSVPGFIINDYGDTIVGRVKLAYSTGETCLHWTNLPDFDALHSALPFDVSAAGGYKYYLPYQIKGFGFVFRGHECFYHSLVLKKDRVGSQKDTYKCFLQLIYQKGDLKLYRQSRGESVMQQKRMYHGKIVPLYIEYYLSWTDKPLGKVQVCSKYQTLKDCLREYGVAEEFIGLRIS